MTFTYQMRIEDHPALDAYGELFGRVQRTLFADLMAERSSTSLKSSYLRRFGILARMFNAARVSVEGKVKGARPGQQRQIESLERRIQRAEQVIGELASAGKHFQVHHKKRRLEMLRQKLVSVQADIAAGRVCIAFGSKKTLASPVQLGREWLRFPWGVAR